jgi:hypothetical protein
MDNSAKAQVTPSLHKQLLRILQFSEGRKPKLLSNDEGLFLVDQMAVSAKCRISPDALKAGLSVGLFEIGKGGAFIEQPEAAMWRKRQMSEASGEGEHAFGRQHQTVQRIALFDGAAVQQVERNLTSSQLGTIARMKSADGARYFPEPLLLAAETLADDFNRAHLQPRITSQWQPRLEEKAKARRNHSADITDQAAHARQRFNHAVTAIGPELSGVVVDAVCFEKGLELIEKERQWPARSAKLMLRTGLEILLRHYQPPASPKPRTRQWHDHL